MRIVFFILLLFLSISAEAISTRLPPQDSLVPCPADKPLWQWELCQKGEADCRPGQSGSGTWRGQCVSCDTTVKVSLYNQFSNCSKVCPNRFNNKHNQCVPNTLFNRINLVLDTLYTTPGFRIFQCVAAVFVFPFVFLFSYILPKNKVWLALSLIGFVGLNIPLRLLPLMIGSVLTIPICVWYLIRAFFQQTKNLLTTKTSRNLTIRNNFIPIFLGLIGLLWFVIPGISALCLMMFTSVYTAVLFRHNLRKENH